MKMSALEIWNTYLDTSGSYQINVDSKARSQCKELLDNPNSSMFESAQLHVKHKIKIKFHFFKNLLSIKFSDL